MASIPVIITSATAGTLTSDQCVAAGAFAFVSKADLARDLARWVTTILSRVGVMAKAA
jgi:CheY-like chemotaxis protein